MSILGAPSRPAPESLVRVSPPLASIIALLASMLVAPDPGAGQDRFGAAIAVTAPDEVVVLKPGKAIGPAAAVVFRLGQDGTWSQVTRLPKLPGGVPGEALIPTLSAGGSLLLMGSGDPDGSEAGHLYRREDRGRQERAQMSNRRRHKRRGQ